MNETNKLIITFAGFGVAILGMLVWVYLQMSTIGKEPFVAEDSLVMEIKKVNKAITDEQAKIDLIPIKQDELQKLTNDQAVAKQLLPKENDPAELMHFITVKAREAEVDADSMKPSKVEVKKRGRVNLKAKSASSGPKFEEWQYEMKLRGTYDQIGVFINKMEEFDITGPDGGRETRFFEVKDIEFEADENGLLEQNASHEVKLTMVTYRYMGEAAPVKPTIGKRR